ncbi:ABATE domain-containing protein [Streptomyces sp. NPDC005065]|uniref:ABATE domain-containing protein n=1 Tax=Streptomyces sp. NPDC005065 TaxID=3154461 RepID=UPI0033BA38FC
MLWTATGRYDLEPAPGGLACVQDLLNTISAGKPHEPDLLKDVDGARTWLAQALANWSGETGRSAPVVETTAGDLQELRDFRHGLPVGPASGPEPGTQAHEREYALAGGVTASPEIHRRGRTPPPCLHTGRRRRPVVSAAAGQSAADGCHIRTPSGPPVRPRGRG